MELNRADVLRMACEAGLRGPHPGMAPEVLKFAELVAASEREVCAKVCDDLTTSDRVSPDWEQGASDCAFAIRARTGQCAASDASREAAIAEAVSGDPWRCPLQDMLAPEGIAVDPRISDAAASLVEQAKAEERAAILALIEAGLDREREAAADKAAREARGTDDELQLMRHWLDVRLWNSAHEKLLVAVKARSQP